MVVQGANTPWFSYVETSQPNHPIIKQVVANDYRAFFDMQMVERQMFNFPPYCRLIQIVLKHRKASVVNSVSRDLANILRRAFGKQVLGPDNPPVGRVQQFYIKHILLKVDVSSSFEKAKKIVDQAIADVQSDDAQIAYCVYGCRSDVTMLQSYNTVFNFVIKKTCKNLHVLVMVMWRRMQKALPSTSETAAHALTNYKYTTIFLNNKIINLKYK